MCQIRTTSGLFTRRGACFSFYLNVNNEARIRAVFYQHIQRLHEMASPCFFAAGPAPGVEVVSLAVENNANHLHQGSFRVAEWLPGVLKPPSNRRIVRFLRGLPPS